MIKANFINRGIDSNEELSIEVIDTTSFIESNLDPIFNETIYKNDSVRKVLNYANSLGVIFKNANTKSTRNYWNIGGNGGLASVPRTSLFHESTFFIHDVMHHAFPELVIDTKHSTLCRKSYILHRLMGEAVCLVLADVVAIQCAKTSDNFGDRNVTDRGIFVPINDKYPNAWSDEGELKAMLWDNIRFVTEGYRTSTELTEYYDWFKPVYQGDLEWTAHNYDSFKVNQQWSERVKNSDCIGGTTISNAVTLLTEAGCTNDSPIHDITKVLFEVFFNEVIFGSEIIKKHKTAVDRFSLHNIKVQLDEGRTELIEYDGDLDCYLDRLRHEYNKVILPIFSNKYISYNTADVDPSDLGVLIDRVLNEPNILRHTREVILNAGGEIFGSRFVTKVGVSKISETKSTISSELVETFNLSPTNEVVDINAKVCYLSTVDGLGERVFNGLGHTSVGNHSHIGFLIAGLSERALLDIASSTANVNRMDSLFGNATNQTLYWTESPSEYKCIREFIKLKDKLSHNTDKAWFNLDSKAMVCTISQSIQDWGYWINRAKNKGSDPELFAIATEIEKHTKVVK